MNPVSRRLLYSKPVKIGALVMIAIMLPSSPIKPTIDMANVAISTAAIVVANASTMRSLSMVSFVLKHWVRQYFSLLYP